MTRPLGRNSTLAGRRSYFQLVAGIWVAISLGTNYSFGIVSNHLKETYNFGQEEVTTISTVGFMLGFFSFPGGALYDYAGPRPVLIIGGLMMSFGFLFLGLTLLGALPHTVAMLAFENTLISMGSSWLDVGCLMTNLFVFPLNRGDIIALQKTFMGLGSTIFALMFEGFFETNYFGYCLFASISIASACFFGAWIIEFPSYILSKRDRARMSELEIERAEATQDTIYKAKPIDPWRVTTGMVLLWSSVIFLATVSLVVAFVKPSETSRNIIACGAIVVIFIFLLIAIPKENPFPCCKGTPSEHKPSTPTSLVKVDGTLEETSGAPEMVEMISAKVLGDNQNGETTPLSAKSESGRGSYFGDSEAVHAHVMKMKKSQFQGTIWNNLIREPIVWVLWWTAFSVWGASLVIIVNSAQIYRSLNDNVFETDTNALYVALMGIGSALGRMFTGFLEQKFRVRGISITVVCALPAVLLVLALPSFLFLPASWLAIPFTLSSFAFGFSCAVNVLIISGLFAQDQGKHYHFTFFSAMVALLALNRFLFGNTYQAESVKQNLYPHCNGVPCVLISFSVLTGLCVTGVISGIGTHFLWKSQCRKAERQSSCEEAKVLD
jgi:MFS family permease